MIDSLEKDQRQQLRSCVREDAYQLPALDPRDSSGSSSERIHRGQTGSEGLAQLWPAPISADGPVKDGKTATDR